MAGPNGLIFFNIRQGSWVAGGFKSGRSVEIIDRVFPSTLFTQRYFRVYQELKVYPIFGFT